MAEASCSSNGDAAASLTALFEAAGIEPAPSRYATPDPTEEPLPLEPQASSSGQNNWRLKFLQKVGIPDAAKGGEGHGDAAESPSSTAEDIFEGESSSELAEESLEFVQEAPSRPTHDIRRDYIKKLENSRSFLPQLNRPKSSQTVTIFDWDDTLLCTSHLETVQRQYGAIPSQVREELASLERVVKSLLVQARQVGKSFIITNASEGWVQHSSSLCMPGLAQELAQVEILSARGAFEAAFPGDSHAWKMHMFLQVQNKLQLEAVTNLVSVGDSHIEMDAVHLLGRSFAHALVKTVKLWERPTPYELQKQLEVVADKLPDIYRAGTTLNIWLERETL